MFLIYVLVKCCNMSDLVESLEIKASIWLKELIARNPVPAPGLTSLLHSLSNKVHHVKDGPEDWRNLQTKFREKQITNVLWFIHV